jgi:hypothetical protein
MTQPCKILYCHCAYAQVIPPEVKQEVLAGLVESGRAFDSVADLCEMSARRDPNLERLAEHAEVRIAACYPRAVKGLFVSAGYPLPKSGPAIVNLRTTSARQALQELLEPTPPIDQESQMSAPQPASPA